MNSEIVKARNQNLSINKLARMFHKSSYFIRNVLVKEGLISETKIKGGGRKRKYSVDDYFFDEIDSEESAYILGFMFADGWVSEQYKQMVITLKYDDVELLEKINKAMNSNFPIKSHYAKYSDKHKSTKKCSIQITSHRIYDNLNKMGCIPRKTDSLHFPQFLKSGKFIRHFLRGYFDGDGTVYVDRNGSICFGIISTKEFCEEYKLHLPCNSKAKITKEYRSEKNVYYFKIGGNNIVKSIYEFLYEDSTIFLSRKKEVFESHFNKIKKS